MIRRTTLDLPVFSSMVFVMVRVALFMMTVLSLVLSFSIKEPCLSHAWGGFEQIQYRYLCYNDIQALYSARHLDTHAFPYLEEKTYEYPPGIAIPMWLTSHLASNYNEYFLANVVVLALAALITVVALIGAVGPRRQVLWFACGLPLLLYAFLNWDLLAVMPVAVAAYFWKKSGDGRGTRAHVPSGDAGRRPAHVALALCGAALGWGAAAKLFPAYIIPALVLSQIVSSKKESGRIAFVPVLSLIGGAAIVWLAWNAPIFLQSPEAWAGMFAFHARRLPDFGTVWYWMAANVAPDAPLRELAWAPVVAPLLGAALALLGCVTAKRHRPEWFRVALICGSASFLLGAVLISPAAGRGPTSQIYKHLVDNLSFALFAGGTLWLLSFQARTNRDPWAIGGAIVILFLLVSKVHSPQYALWLLPFFVLVETPLLMGIGYFSADLALFVSGFYWFLHANDGQTIMWQSIFIASVFARALMLSFLFGWYVLRARDRITKAVTRSDTPTVKTSNAVGLTETPAA